MATESEIQDHVQTVEYLKESARLEADAIAGGADVADILDSVDDFAAAILEALGEAVGPMLESARREAEQYAEILGLEYDEMDLDATEQDARDEFAGWALPIVLASLAPAVQTVQDLTTSGLSSDTIAATLASEGTRDAILARFDSALRSVAASMVQEVETSLLAAAAAFTDQQSQNAGEEPLTLTWVTCEDKNVCEDSFDNSCGPRHGSQATLAEWEEMGGPGSPNLICEMHGGSCRCQLADEGPGDSPINVSEAIARGKERARQEYGQDV
jgi:hypothetical protein